MKVKHIGDGPHFPAMDEKNKPLPFKAFGYVFRGGGWVDVPDTDPVAEKFLNNSHYECKDYKLEGGE